MLSLKEIVKRHLEHEEQTKKRKEQERENTILAFKQCLSDVLILDKQATVDLGRNDIVLNNSGVFPKYVYDVNLEQELLREGFKVFHSDNKVVISYDV